MAATFNVLLPAAFGGLAVVLGVVSLAMAESERVRAMLGILIGLGVIGWFVNGEIQARGELELLQQKIRQIK